MFGPGLGSMTGVGTQSWGFDSPRVQTLSLFQQHHALDVLFVQIHFQAVAFRIQIG